jgi:signal transduction histidine kinase
MGLRFVVSSSLVERVALDAAEQARQHIAAELMTILAHDLRTPLVPLQGYLSMMRQTAERDGQETICAIRH